MIDCRMQREIAYEGSTNDKPCFCLATGSNTRFRTIRPQVAGVIFEIEPRKNYIIRKSSNLSKESQIIAANVDQLFLIVTRNYPVTLTGFIDRYFCSTEAYRIPAGIVFNKIDLYSEDDLGRFGRADIHL